jgi:hypothetical protein
MNGYSNIFYRRVSQRKAIEFSYYYVVLILLRETLRTLR